MPAAWRHGRLDAPVLLLLAGLVLTLAWDASGLDLAVAQVFGTPTGFRWRDAAWASRVLHDGGRWLSIAALVALVAYAAVPAAPGSPRRRVRLAWLAVIAVTVVAVPALKRASPTSCPWDLAQFGGTARYVPHWALGMTDGGPGRCFPSGHAVSSFGFLGTWFLWRERQPALARRALAAVVATGLVGGALQVARGAHYPSHVLWSAWLCGAIAVAADAAMRRWRKR